MSWLPVDPASHFSLANIPFGIISTTNNPKHRPAIAIGNHVLDLDAFSSGGGFSASHDIQAHVDVFSKETLNAFAALGRKFHRATREYLQDILASDTSHPDLLKEHKDFQDRCILSATDVQNHVPMAIGDYTDFYVGKNHAYNVGVLFRGPDNALQPNYTHLPVAYHGRSSSVVMSGTPIRRPWGQILRPGTKEPALAPCEKFDFELEMGMFICRDNNLGEPVPIAEAEQHIFGYVLLNDWSARDIQAWEYVPLGPFTAKNLGTSISPWIVLADAVEKSKTAGIENDKEILPYLKQEEKNTALGIELEVDLITAKGTKTTISKSNSKYLLWSWPQMISHHTITGCNLQTGDLLGSGTISGTEAGSEGSLLEQTNGGKNPRPLEGGEERKYLEDGDTLVLRGWFGQDGARVGFGEVSGTVQPALPLF